MCNISMVSGGGGNEIGGSHHIYNIDGVEIGFDCGGRPYVKETDIVPIYIQDKELSDFIATQSIRPKKDPKPDLSISRKLKYLFLSHGHYDHVGSVPLVTRQNRDLTLYGTKMTYELCEYQWRQTTEIAERNGEIPIFRKSDADHALSRFNIIYPHQSIKINDKISVCAVSAGHIPGAVSFLIYYNDKPIGFHSGDISCTHQRTVGPAEVTRTDSLRFMTIDSTRITEQNPPRQRVEEALMTRVKNAHESGIFVRINSFAIARTQEVFSIVREACPNADIFIDGSARHISDLYHKMGTTGVEGIIECFVRDSSHRRQIIQSSAPNIVMSPSAMAFCATSRGYAEYGITRDNHLFIEPGWTDPCSPEYAFYRSQRGDIFRFGAIDLRRRCDVASYNLTGHADGCDIEEMRANMRPEVTFLVHGEDHKMDTFIGNHQDEGFVKAQNRKRIYI
jgi:uncharacterized protein